MRNINRLVVSFCLGLAIFGCTNKGPQGYEGPTIDAFHGKVTQNGNPVTFEGTEEVQLGLSHETGKHFGVPLKADGTFEIGCCVPTGKYTVLLERKTRSSAKRGIPSKSRYDVPNGLTIEEGKTDYVIELGKDFKP